MTSVFQRLAVATFGAALSFGVVMPVHQANAATFSFTVNGLQPGSGGLLDPTTLTGSFTGNDLNGDGIISGSEVTSFNLDLLNNVISYDSASAPDLSFQLNKSLSYNLSTKSLDFSVLYFPSSTSLSIPNFVTLSAGAGTGFGGSGYAVDFYGPSGNNGYEGENRGISSQLPVVTQLPVPEPGWVVADATLLVFGGLYLLRKKKVRFYR